MTPAEIEARTLNDSDLEGFARRVANYAIESAEAKEIAAAYFGDVFRAHIVNEALAMLKTVAQHERAMAKATAANERTELLRRCARLASAEACCDCDERGLMDPETGEVPCARENRGGVCECAIKIEVGDSIAAKINALRKEGQG